MLTNVDQFGPVGWAVLLGVFAGAAGLLILLVALAYRFLILKSCIQVLFLPPGAFLPGLELLNINKDYQLVEEGEGGEEAQLWGEAILGAAILPQLQEADSGRYLNPYIYILV